MTGSQSQNEGQKRRLAGLTLTVAMELLTAAARHQQSESFCPPFCSFAPVYIFIVPLRQYIYPVSLDIYFLVFFLIQGSDGGLV